MTLDPQTLLLALLVLVPVVFGLGWVASRLDLRQWRRTDRVAPKAYFQGLNLLLNEQTDKAIDAFIEAVQHDPDTSELHFALGNLFRRRGEFERAIRVHEHLLGRADLSPDDRLRARHALAQDFVKAGLFDRAEQSYEALEGTPYATEARLAMLTLAERSRDWDRAVTLAERLERGGAGSFAQRMAHHHCERARQFEARGDLDGARRALDQAQSAGPQAARPLVERAELHRRQGQPEEALAAYQLLRQRHPDAFARVAGDAAATAAQLGLAQALAADLAPMFDRDPGIDLQRALARLQADPAPQADRVVTLLRRNPSLSAALALLDLPPSDWPEGSLPALREALARSARPLQRYRCAACGFQGQHHFWQCPGCLSWDSFPPVRVEEQ